MQLRDGSTTADGSSVEVDSLYDDLVYDPNSIETVGLNPSTVQTLDPLNGLLDINNLKSTTKIEPWMVQPGAFAQAMWLPFERPDHVYARMMGGQGDSADPNRIVIASFAANFFLPWDARLLQVGYQGLFQQDATLYDQEDGFDVDFWELKLWLDDTHLFGARSRLGYTRSFSAGSLTSKTAESRWPYLTSHVMVTSDTHSNEVSKGLHRLYLTAHFEASTDNDLLHRLIVQSGAMSILAIR